MTSVRPPSIALRLALWLSLGTGLLWAGAAGISAYVLSHELNEAYDDALRQGALRLLPLALHDLREPYDRKLSVVQSGDEDGDQDSDDDAPAAGAVPLPYPESYSYVILDRSGVAVLRDEDAPDSLLIKGIPPAGYGHIGTERSYVLSDARTGYSIVVLENGNRRTHALAGSISALVLPLLGLVPLIAGGIWAAMRLALRPLDKLRRDISERHGGNLAPLDASGHPSELVPIVSEVAALMDRLSAALAAERSFAAASAHELRTPIAGALAQTQQLAAELRNHPQARRLREIETALRKLSRLAEKVLQMARLESGFARSDTAADLLPVARLVLRDLENSALGQGRIVFAPPADAALPVRMDADAFAVALRNLVENALVHGAADGSVYVTLEPGPRLSVANDGPAVPSDVISRLGQPFERGSTSAAGTGLGLSIVRTIMRQVGGSLLLQSPAPGRPDGFVATLVFPA